MRAPPPYPPSGGSGDATSIDGTPILQAAPAGPFAADMPLQIADLGGGDLRVIGSSPLGFSGGGTGETTAAGVRTAISAAQSGVNTGLGGTGATGSTPPAFTGTAPTTAVAPALLSGTGLTAAGQVVTTTDNQTVTLNQYQNCWLLPNASPPMLITSHPAATGAPVAFTVFGLASTDAGAYLVLAAPTPVGSVASHTHTGPSHNHTQA